MIMNREVLMFTIQFRWILECITLRLCSEQVFKLFIDVKSGAERTAVRGDGSPS